MELTPAEKLQLVEDIWDSLAADPKNVPIPQWQIDELERREQNRLKNPTAGYTWEEVKQRARSRKNA
jgi:putative addiction module component (TIGR02574 family)